MMDIHIGVGAYKQHDLEAMNPQELEELRGWATDRFNEHLEHHIMTGGAVPPPDCRRCAYFELLASAADDLLIQRERGAS